MSSIYRKGRDGYFYYQTYVNNPKTGKKDKRIFHSLRTKDRSQAKKKQSILDFKYSHIHNPQRKLLGYMALFKNLKVVIIAIIFTISVFSYYNYRSKDEIIFDRSVVQNSNIVNAPINKSFTLQNDTIIEAQQLSTDSAIKTDFHTDSVGKQKPYIAKAIIPNYEIVRVERVSGTFKQGKFYVTVNGNTSNENQRLLCMDIKKRFSEFSNIVICLYANNDAGKNLAKGMNESTTIEAQKLYWLAMYSYNSVEGEYFDDNPSGYLGIY